MARNYSLPTIKTLFFEASACAYPGCDEELIFRDRGATTVVAQIAHIRSERPGGPRHDPTYAGDIDGPENLLLLCGKHHPPVDRHESIYTIAELVEWKIAQRARATDGGTFITDEQARAFSRLSPEESQAMAQVARLAQRVIAATQKTWDAINGVEADREAARQQLERRIGPVWGVDEDGKRELITTPVQLPAVENQRWDQELRRELNVRMAEIGDALNPLLEEIAVLQMMSGEGLSERAEDVARAAGDLPARLRGENRDATTEDLKIAVARLWSAAQGTDLD